MQNADITDEHKHPVLLLSKNLVVALLLRREHFRLAYDGAQTVLSNIRLRYWPLNGLREVKRIIHICLTCFRYIARLSIQIMSDLPKSRVSISRPYQKVGVDFTGSVFIKLSPVRKTSPVKVYMALFIFMVTEAEHMEEVSSLSTNHFIMSLKRFISRRGCPNIIFSDNATNFLGAKNAFKEFFDLLRNQEKSDSIKEYLPQHQITWQFISPRSPHWGGL